MSLQNPLREYGILQERTDYRAHVCFQDKCVYVYRTEAGVKAVLSGRFPKKPAGQPGVEGYTAEGYLVPPSGISGCQRIPIPGEWLQRMRCRREESTTVKGEKAVQIVQAMLRAGRFPVEFRPKAVTDLKMQVDGLDITVGCKLHIQVKCDYYGGESGTGNLYLQVAEANPLKKH